MVLAVGLVFWFAGFADYDLQRTFRIVAINLVASWFFAVYAFGDVFGLFTKGQIFALVENVAFTFP